MPAMTCISQIIRLSNISSPRQKYKSKSPSGYANPIILGMLFCAGGDFALRLDDAGKFIPQTEIPYFLVGLISFLIGHFLFIYAFCKDGGNGLQLKWGVVCYLFAGAIIYSCLQHIPENDIILKVGVSIYGLTIATMTHRSISMYLDAYPRMFSAWIGMCGAIVFVASDSILAVNKFITPVPFAMYFILSTYFSALALIASSCAGHERWTLGRD